MKVSTICATAALAAAVIAGGTLAPSAAEAQSKCNSGSKVSVAIWEKWGAELTKKGCKSSEECMTNASKKEQLVREMIKFWNEQSGGSWATIGPRELLFEGTLDGKVVAGGERLFLTKMPVSDANGLTLTVTKEGGNAPTSVSISTIDEEGRCVEAGDVTFSASDPNGTKKSVRVRAFSNRLVAVKVDAQKGKAFDYELTVRKQ